MAASPTPKTALTDFFVDLSGQGPISKRHYRCPRSMDDGAPKRCQAMVDVAYKATRLEKHLREYHMHETDVVEFFRKRDAEKSSARKRARHMNLLQGTIDAAAVRTTDRLNTDRNIAAVDMIIRTGLPLSFFEAASVRDFMSLLCPDWSPPSRKTIAQTLLPAAESTTTEEAKQLLEEAEGITISSDGWKRGNVQCMSIVASVPQPLLIDVVQVNFAETGENIERVLTKAIEDPQGLLAKHKHKIVGLVTDNAGGIKKARLDMGKKLKCPEVHCMGHAVNLFVQDLLNAPVFKGVVDKATELATTLRKPEASKQLLRKGTTRPESAREDNTRWNAVATMLRSLLARRDVVEDLAEERRPGAPASPDLGMQYHAVAMDSTFWEQALHLLKLLIPLEEWQDAVQADGCTLADAYEFFYDTEDGEGRQCYVHRVKQVAQSTKTRHLFGHQAYRAVVKRLEARKDDLVPKEAEFAYLLDPFRRQRVLRKNGRLAVAKESFIRSMMVVCLNEYDPLTATYRVDPAAAPESELPSFVEACTSGTATHPTLHPDRAHVWSTPGGAAKWWKQWGMDTWPALARAAQQMLSIVPHAAAAERIWSLAGRLYRPQRRRLAFSTLARLTKVAWNRRVLPCRRRPLASSDGTADAVKPPSKRLVRAFADSAAGGGAEGGNEAEGHGSGAAADGGDTIGQFSLWDVTGAQADPDADKDDIAESLVDSAAADAI